MTVRLIAVIADPAHTAPLAKLAQTHHALDVRAAPPPGPNGTHACRILAHPDGQEEQIDGLQTALGPGLDWRIVIIPVDPTIPERLESPEASRGRGKWSGGRICNPEDQPIGKFDG